MPPLDIFQIAVRLVLVSIQFVSRPALPDQPPPPGRLVRPWWSQTPFVLHR